jgi:hypothetical protein
MYDLTRLHTVMQERALTIFGLSKKARMPEATVRQIFQRGNGHPKSIEKMARALGLSLKDIVIPEEIKPPARKSA